MQNSSDDAYDRSVKIKGRTAIDIEHKNILTEDEKRISNKISSIYGVNLEEAKEIHLNYHLYRISSFLFDRARKHGMTYSMFQNRISNTNIIEHAYGVSQGEMIEMAAVDKLYKELCSLEYGTEEDRYISFYS